MNKIDLIIDALECASARENMDLEVKARYEIEDIDLITKALAAARELRELKPVGEFRNVVWCEIDFHMGVISDKKLTLGTKLYALDEVTK